MKQNNKAVWRNILIIFVALSAAFLALIGMGKLFDTLTVAPMIFLLAVFLIALFTDGYLYGIAAAVISVFAVNFAFTLPYFKLNFSIPVNLFSAAIILCVSVMTSTLTTKIKEQQRLKAESEAERLRADLLRAVSHDLRTPLTAISGACSAVIGSYDEMSREQKIKLLSDMKNDSDSLIRMVENLLSVTHIDSDSVTLNKSPIVLEELIDTVMRRFYQRYPQQQVKVSIPGEFITIPMDAILINQVLMNLLENAVFHAEGMTELSLRVTVSGDLAVFEITDNGCGIPPEALTSIFTGYYAKNGAPSDGNRRNMGIGLSVCAAIIHAHGGSIHAENRKGGGALFRFTLKTEPEEEDEQQI